MLTPASDLHQIRILVITSLIMIFGSLPISILHLLSGIPEVGITVLIAEIAGMINLYMIYHWKYFKINAQVAVIIVTLTIITSNIIWGGYYDVNFGWLYLIPLLAALLINLYAMWIYVGLVTIVFILYYLLQQKGILPLHHDTIQNYELLTWFNRLGISYFICLIINAFSAERNRYEQELENSRKKERIANQAKGEFLATISHEIRTPMTGILGMSELLMHSKLEPEQKNYAKVIHQSGELLLGLINDVLDYSKIDSGKMALENAPMDIRLVIEDMLILTSHQAHEKGLEITYYIPPDMPVMLMGDSMRIKQILSNLISNAIKFTAKGEIHIRVNYRSISKNKIEISIHVKDTGIGISQTNKEKIFEAFTQADSSTSRIYGGTGLGLSIVKHLVTMMGGRVTLQSELGKGSEFSAYIPMSVGKDEKSSNEFTNKRLHALCICLNENNQELISSMLEHWNISCQTTHDETIAETLIEASAENSEPYHFIITEHEFLNYASLIKAIKKTSQPLVIALYKTSDATQKISFPDLNIVYLEKPIRQSRLYNIIISTLGMKITDQDPSYIKDAPTYSIHGKILAVEDNAINQALIKAQLDELGIAFDMASNGQEAINAVQNHQYDLILMDCHMPIVDGFMATHAIRRMKDESKSKTIIIALTADALQGDRERCLIEGMDDYIGKPFKRDELIKILEKWLNKDKRGEPNA